VEKLQALALERGELNVNRADDSVALVEKSSDEIPKAPSLKWKQQNVVEGHQPRKVRFQNPSVDSTEFEVLETKNSYD
jgi:hypothetical protein